MSKKGNDDLKDIILHLEEYGNENRAFGYLILDHVQTILQVNRCTVELLRAESEFELLGKPFFDFISHGESSRIKPYLEVAHNDVERQSYLVKSTNKFKVLDVKEVFVRQVDWNDHQNVVMLLFFRDQHEANSARNAESEGYYKRLCNFMEEERRNVGEYLHDNIAQDLFAARISLQHFILENGFHENIHPVKGLLNDAILKLTKISNDLVPFVLRDIGFTHAIEDLVHKFRILGFNYTCKIDPKMNKQTKNLRYSFYRVILKLLESYKRHGVCSEISLKLALRTKILKIFIKEKGDAPGNGENRAVFNADLDNILTGLTEYSGHLETKDSRFGRQMILTYDIN